MSNEEKLGRPTKYKKEYAREAETLTGQGAILPDLAEFFQVSIKTIELWTRKHSSFIGAIKRGRVIADARVKQSLYRRAMGYVDPAGEVVQPNVTAQIFWLKNRCRDEWADVHKLEVQETPAVAAISLTINSEEDTKRLVDKRDVIIDAEEVG